MTNFIPFPLQENRKNIVKTVSVEKQKAPNPLIHSELRALHLVEAGGIEPPSRGISAEASTCVFHLLAFLDPQDSGGQDSSQARARTDIFPRSPARQKAASSLLWSPIPASQARPDERRS